MSDEIRKDGGVSGGDQEMTELPHREDVLPKDSETYTPQGGGSGTGSGPIREVAAVGDKATSEGSDVIALPQVSPEVATAEAMGLGGDSEGPAAGIEKPEASPFRLLFTLGFAGAFAGALLVFAFLWSDPLIQAENARILQEAVTEVLKGPDHFESVFLQDGGLTRQVAEGVDTARLEKVYLGYDAGGNPMGFAVVADGFGFQDKITVIFGYDPEANQVLGMKILDQKETPGLGNKVEEMPFVGEFNGVTAPIEGVKPDRNTGDPHQVDMITGVTISSKAVIKIINDRLAELGTLLAAYEPGESAVAETGTGGQGGDR